MVTTFRKCGTVTIGYYVPLKSGLLLTVAFNNLVTVSNRLVTLPACRQAGISNC